MSPATFKASSTRVQAGDLMTHRCIVAETRLQKTASGTTESVRIDSKLTGTKDRNAMTAQMALQMHCCTSQALGKGED